MADDPILLKQQESPLPDTDQKKDHNTAPPVIEPMTPPPQYTQDPEPSADVTELRGNLDTLQASFDAMQAEFQDLKQAAENKPEDKEDDEDTPLEAIESKVDDFMQKMLDMQESISQMAMEVADLSNDGRGQGSPEEPAIDYMSVDSDELVAVDADADPGYLGAEYSDGVLRADTDGLDYTDGGDYVTIAHKDTSSQASVDNSAGYVIQDVALDTFGHVTSLTSVDLDSRYVQLSGSGSIPSGGLQYQQLTKNSNTDYDVKWDWTRGHA